MGVGGGREAIPLAQKGFEVTGVDFVPEMVAQAKANARRHNVEIEGLVQDISNLEVAQASFDVIWFTTGLYSSIPTRALRISMLQRIHHALRQEGCVVCQFSWNPSAHRSFSSGTTAGHPGRFADLVATASLKTATNSSAILNSSILSATIANCRF